MHRLRWISWIALLCVATLASTAAADLSRRFRRPVALAAAVDGNGVYAANRASGTISVIDTSTRTVAKELDVGGRLVDLAVVDDACLLALDEQHHRLLALAAADADWEVVSSLGVAKFPVRLLFDREASRCFVSSLWSRTLTVVAVAKVGVPARPQLRIVKQLRLPFEPREMCLVRDGAALVVAGSFSGALAVVQTDRMELVATSRIPGHNIRGLAVTEDGKQLWLAQQELNSLAHSTRDDVHWGNMISNLLVSYPVDELCNGAADLLRRRVAIHVGEPGAAASDPGRITVGSTGELVVLLSGVHQVAFGRTKSGSELSRVAVGRRPSDVVSLPRGLVYVANTHSDSISVVELAAEKSVAQISLGPQPEATPAQRGEMLFFDGRLSLDGWMSCHSCHTDGHTNGQLNDNLSDGSFGAPKRVLSLLGVTETGPWAWNGQVETLTQQISNSIQHTMQGEVPSDDQVEALVAYLETLPAPPPADGAAGDAGTGEALFKSLGCGRCHSPPTYTSQQAYDVALVDSVGNATFNPPSLRGVGRRQSFIHDGRADSLEDVFLKHRHQLDRKLDDSELKALLHFLRSI